MATNPIADTKHKPPKWLREAVAGVIYTFLGALAFMFGMEHAHNIWPDVPPIGYWDSFFLLLWLDIVINAILFGVRVKVMGVDSE